MTREEVYRDIEQTIGAVPSAFKMIPDEAIEYEWEAWKHSTIRETTIPNKWKQLILLGMLAATDNEYGVIYRTESAKLHGATDEEINEVLYLAKLEAGWLPFMVGHQVPVEEFRMEVKKMFEHVKSTGVVEKEREKAAI